MQTLTTKTASPGASGAQDAAGVEFGTLFRHLSHYLGGRVGTMLLGFVSFPIFTRLFSVQQYGQISLVLTAVVFATAFAKLGLQNSAYRYYEEHVVKADAHSAVRFQSTLYLGTVLTGSLSAAAFVAAINLLPPAWISPELRPLLSLGGALILVRGVQSIVLSLFQAEGRTGAYNAVDLATKLVTVPSILLLVYFWRVDPRAYFGGTIIGEGAVMLAATVLLQRKRHIRPDRLHWGFLKELLAFGVPLAACELAKIALDMIDRFLVQFYMGSMAVGYYSAAYNIATYMQNSLLVPLGLALPPLYMKVWNHRGGAATSDFLSRTLKYYVILAGALISVGSVCSADVLTILASAKYRAAHQLLPILIAGIVFYGIHLFLNAGLFIYRKTGLAAVVVAASCGLNILLNCVLIPRIGLNGAAIATLVSYVAFVVIMVWVSTRYLPLKIPYLAGLKAMVCGGTVLLLVRFDVGGPLPTFLLRGTAGVCLYLLLISLLDREIGGLLGKGVRRAWAGLGVLAG